MHNHQSSTLHHKQLLYRIKMKLVAVLAVLAAVLLIVNADFYINLYDQNLKKYLSAMNFIADGNYMVAAKSNPDQFCKFKLVILGRKVAIQNDAGTNYFCHVQSGNSSIDVYIRPVESTIKDSCKFNYRLKLDPDNICGARIALKADNGLYWTVLAQNSVNYIRPLATSPVYFHMRSPKGK